MGVTAGVTASAPVGPPPGAPGLGHGGVVDGSVASLRRLQTTTLSLLVAFVFLVLFAGVYHLAQQYNETVEAALRSARATVRTVAAHAERTFGESYRVLDGIADLYKAQLRMGRVDEYELHRALASKLVQMPYVAGLLLTAPDGRMLSTSRNYPMTNEMGVPAEVRLWSADARPVEVEPGHFFGWLYQSHRQGAGPEWYLPIGVRADDEQGNTVGYVIAIIRAGEFGRFYDGIDVGAGGSIGLWQSDGRLAAASRGAADAPGDRRAEIEDYFDAVPAAAEGATELVYAIADGYSRRVQATGRIGILPLAAAVNLSSESYLAAWRDSRNRIGLAVVLIVVATMFGGLFIYQQLRRAQLNERALRQAKVTAEEASEAKSRFLAHMSHEFRTPLNAIMGFSEIIKTKVLGEGVSPIYVSYAEHIHRSGEHLLKIVNDILDMAKIESGAQPMAREPVDVAATVDGAVSFVEGLADQKRLHIRVLMPAQLPRINGNERLTRQVIINLLSNAIKFSPRSAEIELVARHADGGPLEISITDRGPGIEPAMLRRIGEPFLQGNPAISRAGQGTGLGLSICKNYLNLMGGELIIDSVVGSGTTATVRFPAFMLTPRQQAAA
ncbi:MAG: sensor histidine kinase [Rhodospirillaceae bacterium]|nr:sensor histidine kinase [Rhodospirillaceae bacterium]